MNTHFTYFYILLAALIGPLVLSFDKKVAFYKNYKYLFKALLFPAIFYIIWDIFFTAKGVWSFNEKYITGFKFFNLPIEEILFFFIVPYCCIFIYQCVQCYFPNLKKNALSNNLLKALAVIFFIMGIIFYPKKYSCFTFLFNSLFIVFIFIYKRKFTNFNAHLFLITYGIVLLPFLVVNGFLTALPIVLYNSAENLGVKIFTIPLEDIFYGMLLLLMNITLYEKFKNMSGKT